uniref:O-fucosyltransferase family protein n=1 Tax=Salix viminalis TaxID=40686 RepID=A0A6N2LP20_SALVM
MTSSSFLALGKKEEAAAVERERERETENKHIEKSSEEEDNDAEAKMEERGFDEEDAIMRHLHDCHDGPPLRALTRDKILGKEQEQSWTSEITPPSVYKGPLSSHQCSDRNPNCTKLWKPPPNRNYMPCTQPSPNYTSPSESRGYLLAHTNGGLNQMRAGICDMVAIAHIINATLVVPKLDKKSYWQDSSNFSDVFDEDHFINALANDVKVIKKLPNEIGSSMKAVKYFKSWSGMDYYQEEIASMWADYKVIRAAKTDSRLANNNLPPDIQKLRCRACYEALRFCT